MGTDNFYVYFHLSQDSIFYVGKGMHYSGWDGDEKYSRAKSLRSRSKLWNNIVNKHGFTYHILLDNLQENEAFYWEKFYIKLLGRRDLNEGNLANHTNGGDGVSGYKFTEEDKAKHSKSLSIAMKDRIMTVDHRKKLSDRRKTMIFNDAQRKGIGVGNSKRLNKQVIATHRISGEQLKFNSITDLRTYFKIGYKKAIENSHENYSFLIAKTKGEKLYK